MRPFLAALALLSSCNSVDCTTEVRYSVQVEVLDAWQDAPLPDATVTYTVDGGATQPCEHLGVGTYLCGEDEPGEFSITATHPDFLPETETTTVTADECHVITQNMTLGLTTEDQQPICTGEEVPSVRVTVQGVGWDPANPYPIPNGSVTWRQGDGTETACDVMNSNDHLCGREVAGEITWTASAPDHSTASGTVTVESDECHVITALATATLECLNC